MSEQINGDGFAPTRGCRPPGLPRSERPHLHLYLVRRKRDGTHWQALAMNWGRQEVVLFDYKNPEAEPIMERFEDLDFVDKQEIGGLPPEIVLGR